MPERPGRGLAEPLAAGAAAGIAGALTGGALAIPAGALAALAAALGYRALRTAIQSGRSGGQSGRVAPRAEPAPGATGGLPSAAAGPEPATTRAAAGLVRQLPVPAILVDSRREILAASRPAEELLRRVAEGRTLPNAIRQPELLAAVQQAIADGAGREVTIRESVPRERHIQALVAPFDPAPSGLAASAQGGRPAGPEGRDGAESAEGALILLRDLTPQMRADRIRGDLVANVSHELRTPLASLAGFLETLRGPAADDAAARDRFLRIMAEQTARMTRLVDTLLSLSNIERDEHRPPDGLVELNATVGRVVDALGIVAERLGCRIALTAGPEPVDIVGDEDQIARVARNLIENAIKYGRPGAAIDVRVFLPGGSGGEAGGAALSVGDSGDGIPEEHLPRLTERFYRVDTARARNAAPGLEAGGSEQAPDSGGAGLGLAIVKHIVARHGGRLEIASERGVGSRFTVLFPPAPAAPGTERSADQGGAPDRARQ